MVSMMYFGTGKWYGVGLLAHCDPLGQDSVYYVASRAPTLTGEGLGIPQVSGFNSDPGPNRF